MSKNTYRVTGSISFTRNFALDRWSGELREGWSPTTEQETVTANFLAPNVEDAARMFRWRAHNFISDLSDIKRDVQRAAMRTLEMKISISEVMITEAAVLALDVHTS